MVRNRVFSCLVIPYRYSARTTLGWHEPLSVNPLFREEFRNFPRDFKTLKDPPGAKLWVRDEIKSDFYLALFGLQGIFISLNFNKIRT